MAGQLHFNMKRILAVSFAHHHHKRQGEASNLEIPIALLFSHSLTSFLSKAVVHSTVLQYCRMLVCTGFRAKQIFVKKKPWAIWTRFNLHVIDEEPSRATIKPEQDTRSTGSTNDISDHFRDKTKPSKQNAPNVPMLCQQNATNVILKWSLNSDLATRKTSSATIPTTNERRITPYNIISGFFLAIF